MNAVQELVVSRLGSKTKVVFALSPGYSSMPPTLQIVYAMLVLIAEGMWLRMLMAAPTRELEQVNVRLLKSEVAAAWADVYHPLKGFYELVNILIVLDEVLCREISNLARQLNFNPEIREDNPVVGHLTASLWFRSIELTSIGSTSSAKGPINDRRN